MNTYRLVTDKINSGEGWLVFLDIYGFSAMVQDEQLSQEILGRLVQCHQATSTIVKSDEPSPLIVIFSDSTFLFYQVDGIRQKNFALEKCFRDIKMIMSAFIEQGLPLRGGIAYGPMFWLANILIGAPLVRAVNTERNCPAPIVLLPMSECSESSHSSTNHITPRSRVITLKDGSNIRGSLIYPDEVFKFSKFVDIMISNSLIHGPPAVEKQWEDAKLFLVSYIKELNE